MPQQLWEVLQKIRVGRVGWDERVAEWAVLTPPQLPQPCTLFLPDKLQRHLETAAATSLMSNMETT